MRKKLAKELRQAMKNHGLDVKGPPKYEMINKVNRLVYMQNEKTGKMEAVKVTRGQIINHTKLGYRRLKRDVKAGLFNQ